MTERDTTAQAGLTAGRLDEIETRHKAATPGPWTAVELPPNEHHPRPAYWVNADYTDTDDCRTHETVADCPWRMTDAAFIAHAREDVPALLAEVRRLKDELAETKAANDPRLRGLLVKAAPDKDLYVHWSTVCDMPGGVFSRETALEYGFPRSKVDHADEHGSSSRIGDGAWDDKGWVAEQRGWLRRDLIGEYAVEYLTGDREAAYRLLEPFDDDPAVSSVV
ncbi:hypothetical protein [Streptomyces caniscabiei]|uniref:hypothetical protein n=1 Tax=Streptomyces caniscabiei TaxID=2746961 RepID=UPI0018733753|nr:hypothetical protein [Streptomyces caniscabiei]MBE4796163.1 hypothetical protein [Streptomyces caniscabiei]MDX2944471.1 hypothetical protein [Streptomyces caniscabiei]